MALDGKEREALEEIARRIRGAADHLARYPYGTPRAPDKDHQVAKLNKLAQDTAALAAREGTERPEGQTTNLVAVEALDEIGLVRVEIDLAESPYLLGVSQARNLGELLIGAADKLTHTEQERER